MPRVIVYHAAYGCETGCCGHIVAVTDGAPSYDDDGKFQWEHPYGEEPVEFAKRLVRDTLGEEHVADLDWDGCVISDD